MRCYNPKWIDKQKLQVTTVFFFLKPGEKRPYVYKPENYESQAGLFKEVSRFFFHRKPQNIQWYLRKGTHILGFIQPIFSRFYACLQGFRILLFHPSFNRDSGKRDFLPVNIYYNTSCEILQAKKRIFFRFYFNLLILCIFYYVNQCIFWNTGYVVSTKSGMNKNTHVHGVCIFLFITD